MNIQNEVYFNQQYEGLAYETAQELRGYFHFRRPEGQLPAAMLNQPGVIATGDFLDCIDKDFPKGTEQIAPSLELFYLRYQLMFRFLLSHFIICKLSDRDVRVELWSVKVDESASASLVLGGLRLLRRARRGGLVFCTHIRRRVLWLGHPQPRHLVPTVMM